METSNYSINELKKTWRSLCAEMKKTRKLKFEVFETVFAQTYSMLSSCVAEKGIEKDYVMLIAEAYLFSKSNDNVNDVTCLSACVLTERMLNHVLNGNTSEITNIYVFEAHEEAVLNFNNVNESITTLKDLYENTTLDKSIYI